MKKTINFIIPCAGKGTRLGIATAKELFPLDKNLVLIDKCFEYIKPFKDRAQVTIIISQDKSDLIKYLNKYSDEFDIIFVYQKSYLCELTGAIKSAQNYFLDSNILLLPDIYLEDKEFFKKFYMYVTFSLTLPIQYLTVGETDFNRLSKVGALKIEEHKIIKAEDKPKVNKDYNAYWVSLSFKNEIADDFLNNFQLMQQHKKYNKFIWNAHTIQIDYAIDLGVWENIKSFNERKYSYENLKSE